MRTRIDKLWPTVDNRIKWQRERYGKTQEWLAARVGLGRTSIVNLECGRQEVPLVKLVKICRVLRLSPSSLLQGFV